MDQWLSSEGVSRKSEGEIGELASLGVTHAVKETRKNP